MLEAIIKAARVRNLQLVIVPGEATPPWVVTPHEDWPLGWYGATLEWDETETTGLWPSELPEDHWSHGITEDIPF